MDHRAQLVRSVVSWALRVAAEDDTPIQLPRLSQFQIGKMLCRTDPATCIALAEDIHRDDATDEMVWRTARDIIDGFGEETPTRVVDDRQEMALEIVRAMARSLRGEDLRLVDLGSRVRSWADLEDHFGGRVWFSLRDDFEQAAVKLYVAEEMLILIAADHARRKR